MIRLTATGFTLWLDRNRLSPGCDWHKEIEAGCEAARVILSILTPRWKKSEWTRYETYGHDLVIPLVFEGKFLAKDAHGDIDEVASVSTPPLRRFQMETIDLLHVDNYDWSGVVESIRSALTRPIPERGKRLIRMRYGHTEYFVGREDKLNEVHEKLWISPTATLTQGHVQAVTALGGVGKTTLARAYADRFWRLYPQAFWVDCRLGIENEFAAIFDLLFPKSAKSGLDINLEAEKAFGELSQPADRPLRLLVLDDAPDEQAVSSWIPRTSRCHTIVTSRFTGWSNPREVCSVGVLEPEPARKLLLARAGRDLETLSTDEAAAIDNLAELLGYLPLALEQAAAYTGAPGTSCTYRDYIRRYHMARKHFLSQLQSRGSTEYPASVYATWRTTIDCLPAGSRAILRLAAFMAPTPIPQALWVKSSSIVDKRAREISALAQDNLPPEIQIPGWIAALARYSMVTPQAVVENPTFSVHGLVQAVEADSIATDAVPGWIEDVRASLLAFAPEETAEDPKTWPIWDVLRPHAERLKDLAFADERVEPSLTLMESLGSLYYGKGLYGENLAIDEAALKVSERVDGPESANFAQRLLCYGETLRAMGRYPEAEAEFRKSLAIREKVDGCASLSVASILNYLAITVGAQRRFSEEEDLLRKSLAIYESGANKEEGKTDEDGFVKVLNNLALRLSKRGAFDEAEQMLRKALSIAEPELGEKHPRTLGTLHNLSSILSGKGDKAAAEPFIRRALERMEPVLGRDHPYTLTSTYELATLLQAKGDYAGAERLVRRAQEGMERALGVNHPSTLTAVAGLAELLEATGRFEEAIPLRESALEGQERNLGPEHPDMLRGWNQLSHALRRQGHAGLAEPIDRRVAATTAKILGDINPLAIHRRNNLVLTLIMLGKWGEACQILAAN